MNRIASARLLTLAAFLAASASAAGLAAWTSASMLRVSCSASAGQASGPSAAPSLSGDGRYVALVTWATNLAPACTFVSWPPTIGCQMPPRKSPRGRKLITEAARTPGSWRRSSSTL